MRRFLATLLALSAVCAPCQPARNFNGTNQAAQVNVSINAGAATFAFWLWWNTFANNDALLMEETSNYNNVAGAFIFDPNTGTPPTGCSAGGFTIIQVQTANTTYTGVNVTRPSAAAWHHFVVVFDPSASGATNIWTVYIDGAVTSPTACGGGTTAQNINNQGGLGQPINFFSRNQASLFGAGKISRFGLWNAKLTANEAASLASCRDPQLVRSDKLQMLIPFYGVDSPEPDWSGFKNSATLTNSPTLVDEPPACSGPGTGAGVGL